MKKLLMLLVVLYLGLNATSTFAQHGQSVQLKTNHRWDFNSERGVDELAVIMNNFPKSPGEKFSEVHWRLIRPSRIIERSGFGDGNGFVLFDITKLKDGQYFLTNDYHIWEENGVRLKDAYTFFVEISITLKTEKDQYGNYRKRISSDSCDADGNFKGQWSRSIRRIGNVNVEISGDTLTIVVSDSDSCSVTVRNMFSFEVVRHEITNKPTVVKFYAGDLEQTLYLFRILRRDGDFYESVKGLKRGNGLLTLEDPI